MPELAKPKLVNRGSAGLLTKVKLPETEESKAPVEIIKNNIAKNLRGLVVKISLLTLDPNNARLHPDRNLDAIKESLNAYGQVKPVVVQKKSDDGSKVNIIIAGNGTTEAALSMGWDEIAASIVDMTDAQAAGYGLADNRTAELAKWDFEVVARLDKLVSEAGLPMSGWSKDELEILRLADWTPPEINDDIQSSNNKSEKAVEFDDEQWAIIERGVAWMRELYSDPELAVAECLTRFVDVPEPELEPEQEELVHASPQSEEVP